MINIKKSDNIVTDLLGMKMNYKVESILVFKYDYDILLSRLEKWSEKYNFKLLGNNTGEKKLIYKRGNHFRASCSFDVRYVPTTVSVQLLDNENKIIIKFHVKSYFYKAFPSDPDRVNEQLELLIAYLRGSFDENLDYVVKI